MASPFQSGSEGWDAIVKQLQERMKDRDKAVEQAVADKYSALEGKEAELRQLKSALRERERDIERANQMLLTTEEAMDVSPKKYDNRGGSWFSE